MLPCIKMLEVKEVTLSSCNVSWLFSLLPFLRDWMPQSSAGRCWGQWVAELCTSLHGSFFSMIAQKLTDIEQGKGRGAVGKGRSWRTWRKKKFSPSPQISQHTKRAEDRPVDEESRGVCCFLEVPRKGAMFPRGKVAFSRQTAETQEPSL